MSPAAPVNLTSRGKRKAHLKSCCQMLCAEISFFIRFEGKLGNNGQSWKKLGKARENWGTQGSALGTAEYWVVLMRVNVKNINKKLPKRTPISPRGPKNPQEVPGEPPRDPGASKKLPQEVPDPGPQMEPKINENRQNIDPRGPRGTHYWLICTPVFLYFLDLYPQ